MKAKRDYTMTARAKSVQATRASIIGALEELAGTRFLAEIGLEDVATLAGVSVQTVLRHFGSRAQLFEAATQQSQAEVEEGRRTPVGDVGAAMLVLADHYEAWGRTALLMLAQEDTEEMAARVTDGGKAMHRAWVSEVFAPLLPPASAAREEAVDLLVVACDVYTWKLLRVDRKLSRAKTQQRMEHLVRAVLTSLGTTPEK